MKWIVCFIGWMLGTVVYGQGDSVYLKQYNWVTGIKETIPSWITGVQDRKRFVGISDPGLKPEVARQQALLRAWMLCLLDEEVKIAMVKDYYLQSKRQFEYELSKDKLITLLTLQPAIKIVYFRKGREWFSQYGECFAEFFVMNEEPSEVLPDVLTLKGKDAGIMGELLLVSNGNLQERQELRVDWKVKCPEITDVKECDFLLRGNREYRTLFRNVNGYTLPESERGRYWYSDTDTEPEANITYCRLEDAFWCAAMESVVYAFMAHSFAEVSLQNLEEEGGEIRETLKRELVKTCIRLRMKKISIRNSRLYVDWQIVEK